MILQDKDRIYTVIGEYQENNTIITLSGEVVKMITYRKYNKTLYNKMIVANLKYTEKIGRWTMFQAIELNEGELIKIQSWEKDKEI